MSDLDNPTRSDLRKASELIQAGKEREARQILRNLLLSDQHNLEAWKLLSGISEHNDEKAFCQEQILRLSALQKGSSQPLSIREKLLPSEGGPQKSPQKPAQKPNQEPAPAPPVIIPGAPLWSGDSFQDEEPSPVEEKRAHRKRSLAPLWIGVIILVGCLGLWGLALLTAGFLPVSMPINLTATAAAEREAYCAALVQNALEASGDFCDQIGPNRVCYGNITLQAELQPDAQDRFEQRGDVIAVNLLRRLSAAPLDLVTNEWGVAIFKVMANLPSSLPGQTVTMVVFGNTVLDNQSGNLEAFYFFSQLGRIVCEKAQSDGLLITMPDGAGITFMVNGTELTLMGDASLTATQNGEMQVSMHSGSGSIIADGVEQSFGAGEKVTVPLGGPTGADAIGPPSAPEGLTDEEREEICLMTGQLCPEDETQTAGAPTLPGGVSTGTRTATTTRTPTRTTTPSPSITSTLWYRTLTASRTPTSPPTSTVALANTATRSRTPRPTRTPRPGSGPTNTPLPTATRTSTATRTPTQTLTPTQTFTPSLTFTPTQTFTNTPAPSACGGLASAGSLDNPGGLNTLTMDITNNSGATATISEIRVVWDVATATRLQQIYLGLPVGGPTTIASPNSTSSPEVIPTDHPFVGAIGARRIADADTQPLTISFMDDLASGSGYTVRVTLAEPNCYVEASR